MIKFKIGRHWLVKALVGVALVATIGFSPHNRVMAGKDSGGGNLGVVGAGNGVYVDKEGNEYGFYSSIFI